MDEKLIYDSKRLKAYSEKLLFKNFLKPFQKVYFAEVKNMVAQLFPRNPNHEQLSVSLFTNKWCSFSTKANSSSQRREILAFLKEQMIPIILRNAFSEFDTNKVMKIGKLSVCKTRGIVKTNNIEREISWSRIKQLDFYYKELGNNFCRITFMDREWDEVFEFDPDFGNTIQHEFLILLFTKIIGEEKVIIAGRENYGSDCENF